MLRRLYEWLMRLAASRHATGALALLAFGEAFIVPVPPDALLAPMVLARPERAWLNTAVCAVGSVVGAVVGYYIGFALQPVALSILALTGHASAAPQIMAADAKYGVAVILAGVAPILPFPAITLSSGMAQLSLWQFILAASVARGLRFVALTAIVKRFGPAIVLAVERRLALTMLILSGLVATALIAWLTLH